MTKPQMTLETPIVVGCQVTNICNLDCKQCYTECSRSSPPGEMTSDEWKQQIDYLADNGVVHLYFEGGDPLLRPDFLDLLRYAQKRFLLWFRTHATTMTPQLAKEIADIGLGRVVIDFFGTDAEMHDHLTGVPGSFERTWAGARLLRAEGVPVIPAAIVNRLNVPHLQRYVEFGTELEAEELGLLRLYPIGAAKRNWAELSPRPLDIIEAIAALDVPDGFRVMNGFHPHDANCCWVNAHITSTGDSIGCPYLRGMTNYGNVREVPFLETWGHPLYEQLRSQPIEGDCPECTKNRMLSPGGCRSSAYTFTGRWDGADPYCPNMNYHDIDVTVLPGTRMLPVVDRG
jgi:MoaA/NifB/PqqE/SkfB family radical SAM enzyme